MRENRLYGSEGGVAKAIPTPICACARRMSRVQAGMKERPPARTKEVTR
jgi:hypothetical protein